MRTKWKARHASPSTTRVRITDEWFHGFLAEHVRQAPWTWLFIQWLRLQAEDPKLQAYDNVTRVRATVVRETSNELTSQIPLEIEVEVDGKVSAEKYALRAFRRMLRSESLAQYTLDPTICDVAADTVYRLAREYQTPCAVFMQDGLWNVIGTKADELLVEAERATLTSRVLHPRVLELPIPEQAHEHLRKGTDLQP